MTAPGFDRDALRRALEEAVGTELESIVDRLRHVPEMVDRVLNAADVREAEAAASALTEHLGISDSSASRIRDALRNQPGKSYEVELTDDVGLSDVVVRVSDHDEGHTTEGESVVALAGLARIAGSAHGVATIRIEEVTDELNRRAFVFAAVALSVLIAVPLARGEPTTRQALIAYIELVAALLFIFIAILGGEN